ncbi:bile acid:sodium symporter family protein [Lunatibacter salilacus]|uniref:bile acid:sodium symporter family protein n=1 Tax=Lunatibacter salilacus TaxID=2483804 RepID=UPI001F2D7706|nr:bile acid:sodium symporter family protein [Lunatibacter salilacus]
MWKKSNLAILLGVFSMAIWITALTLTFFQIYPLAKLAAFLGIVGFLILIQFSSTVKGFSFTAWVLAAVGMALMYPHHITVFLGFSTEDWIVPLIQLIMFGMGTTMGITDFYGILRMPKGVLIGLGCQFTIMPILAVILANVFGFPPEIAAGVILIGSSPSGVSSNIITYLAKGNLPLSITLTSFTTLLAPLVTPLLMKYLAGHYISLDYMSMMYGIIKMLFIPVILGILVNRLLRTRATWIQKAMPGVAMGANVLIIAIIIAVGRDSLLTLGIALLLGAIIHNAIGFLLGYWSCRFLGMSKIDCRTIAIEVGMQNGGMAAGIASDMGKAATMGLFPAIFGTWMDISGSFLANLWRKSLPKTVQPLKDSK